MRTLHSDVDAQFDAVVELDASDIKPQVTWGTSPEMLPILKAGADPQNEPDATKRDGMERALKYMGLAANGYRPIISIRYLWLVHQLAY